MHHAAQRSPLPTARRLRSGRGRDEGEARASVVHLITTLTRGVQQRALAARGCGPSQQFIWSSNTRAPNNAPLAEIFGAYKQVCHPDTCVDDTGARIPGCVPELATCIDAPGKRIASCTLKLCDLDAAGMPRANLLSYTWLPLPTSMATAHQRSYRRGVEHYYNADAAAAAGTGDTALEDALIARRGHFIQMALDHGINENTAP